MEYFNGEQLKSLASKSDSIVVISDQHGQLISFYKRDSVTPFITLTFEYGLKSDTLFRQFADLGGDLFATSFFHILRKGDRVYFEYTNEGPYDKDEKLMVLQARVIRNNRILRFPLTMHFA